MSSTGTRNERNVQTRVTEALIEADKNLINSFKIFSESSNSIAGLSGSPAQNSPKTPAGNYLAREGDSMIGPLALGPPLDFRVEIDISNTIDVGILNDNAQFSSNILLDSIQPNSFVLDIIANAAFDGQILIIRTFAPSTPFTISQGTLGNGGNIQTADDNDTTVGDLQMLVLVFDESLIINANTGGTWRVLGAFGGGGTVQDPIILNENNIGFVGVPGAIDVDFSVANFHRMELGADVSINLTNLPIAGKWETIILEFTQDGTGGHDVTFNDTFDNNITPIVNTGPDTITYIIFYSYNDGVNQIIIATPSVSDFASGVADPNYLLARLSANQTANTANDDQIEFDTVVNGDGLTVNNGIVSGFLAGHIYELEAVAAFIERGAGTGPVNVDIQFFDIAGAVLIGTKGNGIGYNSTAEFTPQILASAIFLPSADTNTIELRIKSPNLTLDVVAGTSANQPQTYLKITDITGFVGGGGTTVLFPKILIQDVQTITNPGATVNLNLSNFQSFVLEIDADLEITFTGLPSGTDREEQFKLEIIQDAFGGHDVTYSQTISPVDPPVIDTGANKREVLVGFAKRDDIGTIFFNIYTVGSS